MVLPPDYLDEVGPATDRSFDPLVVPWPMPGNLGGFQSFATFAEWRRFVLQLSLHDSLPQIVTLKFERAQKLYLLTWVDFDLIKAGELIALTTLELALKDRYGSAIKSTRKNIYLPQLLEHMVEHDGLTDALIPMCAKYGGTIVPNLYETAAARRNRKGTIIAPPMTIANIRNSLAHGYPFDGLPWSGLLELVRDLVEYAYRQWIAQAPDQRSHQIYSLEYDNDLSELEFLHKS